MAEYIERAKVKDELLSWAVCINHPEHLLKEDALCVIDSIPAAEVEPVTHGRWKLGYVEPGYYTPGGNRPWVCSKCGQVISWMLDKPMEHYCSNCGAKMDKEDSDG